MSKTIRMGVLSFWHVHAYDYARQAETLPHTEIVAVWDEVSVRGQAEAATRNVRYYERLEDLLENPDIDAVIVTTPTENHPEVIKAAARAGKHIFTEKVLALTTQACNDMLQVIKSAGIQLTVSLPRLNTPFTQGAQALINSGILGELTLVRTRLSHSGALPTEESPLGYLPAHFFDLKQTGGGALTDLGCHPMYLAAQLLGMPESVSASFGYMTNKEIEDNAVVTLRYPSGALAVVEAGFVNSCSPFTLEVHGMYGSLIYSAHNGKLLYRSMKVGGDPKAWHEYELPEALPSSFEQWVSHIQTGTSDESNIQVALQLTRLIEASNLSAKTDCIIRLDQLTE